MISLLFEKRPQTSIHINFLFQEGSDGTYLVRHKSEELKHLPFLLELKTKYAGHYTDINNQLDVIEVVFR